MKYCPGCLQSLLLETFNKNRTTTDGLQTYCRKCQTEKNLRWAKANPEKVRQAVRRWQKAHPENMRERVRRYQKAHPELVRDRLLRWKKANPEKVRQQQRRYNKAHPEKMRETNRRWKKANPEKVRAHRRRFRETHREQERARGRRRYQEQSEQTKERIRKQQFYWRKANPEKVREAKRRQIKFVPLQKFFMLPTNPRTHVCQDCGRTRRLDERQFNLHHEIYDSSDPGAHLIELCAACHVKRHQEIRKRLKGDC